MYERIKYNGIVYLIPQYELERWDLTYPPNTYQRLLEAYLYKLYEATGIIIEN